MQNNTWARLLAYVTGLVNQRPLLECEYLPAENRILRSHLPARVRLSDPERRTLAEIGRRLARRLLSEVACIAKPETILGWCRRAHGYPRRHGPLHRRVPDLAWTRHERVGRTEPSPIGNNTDCRITADKPANQNRYGYSFSVKMVSPPLGRKPREQRSPHRTASTVLYDPLDATNNALTDFGDLETDSMGPVEMLLFAIGIVAPFSFVTGAAASGTDGWSSVLWFHHVPSQHSAITVKNGHLNI